MQNKIDNFVLIVGAMKSGTTSLYNYMIQHPQIAECKVKEVNFFGKPSRFNKGFDFYQSLWNNWDSQVHKYALEATPSYTRVTHPKGYNAAAKIAQVQQETGANFKFIYILRDPVDRIESHLTHGRKHRYKNASKSLTKGVHSEIIDTSRYAMQISEYYQRFSKDDILLLKFEDLKINPQSQMKKVCQFLSLDSSYDFSNVISVYNAYSRNSTRIMIPGYPILRKSGLFKDLFKFTSKSFKQKARKIRNLFATQYENDYVKFSKEQREDILKELEADLRKLQDTYNFNVSNWQV